MEFRNDDRYATQRGRMLSRELDLRRPEGEAIAYCERGYSFGGAADKMDTSKGTVKNYVERAICLYGYEIAENLVIDDDEELPDYDRVEPDYMTARTREDGRKWVGLVMNYEGKLPADFVEDVREASLKNGLRPSGDL